MRRTGLEYRVEDKGIQLKLQFFGKPEVFRNSLRNTPSRIAGVWSHGFSFNVRVSQGMPEMLRENDAAAMSALRMIPYCASWWNLKE